MTTPFRASARSLGWFERDCRQGQRQTTRPDRSAAGRIRGVPPTSPACPGYPPLQLPLPFKAIVKALKHVAFTRTRFRPWHQP